MEITLSAFTLRPACQLHGSNIVIREYYSESLISDGLEVQGSPIGSSQFFGSIPCTVDSETGLLTAGTSTLITTTNSDHPNARVVGVLYQGNRSLNYTVFSWRVPNSLGETVNFESIQAYNNSGPLVVPQPTYPTVDIVASMIQAALGDRDFAAAGVAGITELSVDPEVANHPKAFGVNDPAVGDLHGSLTPNRVPVSSTSKNVIDSQIEDDGTDVNIQTLNKVQFGDFEELQNNSYISVNDSFTEQGGRAVVRAGGNNAAEYANLAMDCSTGIAEVYLQSTGITNLYAANQVTILGDGKNEQNRTQVVINDPLMMVLQTAANQVPNDPSIGNNQICFYLDESGDVLKVRVRYSDGSLKTGEIPLT